MAEERTEEATPHKREKVREEGRVCMSKDLNAAVAIITALLGMAMLGAGMWRTLSGLIVYMMRAIGDQTILQEGWFAAVSWEAVKRYFATWLPLGGLVVLFSTCTVIAQVGFAMTGEPFGPKFDRLNPFTGMKKIISMRSVVELLKGLLKASIFAVMIYTAIRKYLPVSSKTMQMPLDVGSLEFWNMLWRLAMRLALMLLVMAAADYWYQKWDFEKSIRMSKKEVKDEYKQMEGDPQIKQKIRQKQREMARNRMMSDVPKADVVITNPTHIAVAIQYERGIMGAPQVIAKGADYIAQRIREIAELNLIPRRVRARREYIAGGGDLQLPRLPTGRADQCPGHMRRPRRTLRLCEVEVLRPRNRTQAGVLEALERPPQVLLREAQLAGVRVAERHRTAERLQRHRITLLQ